MGRIEYLKHIVEYKNQQHGNLTGYDCPICLNKGFILSYHEENETIDSKECKCMLKRRNQKDIAKQGLTELFESYRFENFLTDNDWQKKMKIKAQNYANHPKGWLFIGGQIGSGKTILGVSVLNELMAKGHRCKMITWQMLMQQLKTFVNEQEYFDILNDLDKIEFLMIDDLFKVGKTNTPTESDVRLTQIVIDRRYTQGLKTILTSELFIDDIIDNISESIGSRINERAKGNKIQSVRDKERNYRLIKGE